MNLQGDFEGLFLTSILQLLCNDQKTGLLRVTSGNNECKVFFDEGTIVYASGSQKEVRLGYILRRDGIISADQLQKCLALGREQKMSLGKILVDKGYVSLNTLNKYNTKQVEEILYSLLLWKKGKFEYKDIKLNLEGMVITQLNPMKLILEASRRIDEMSVLNTVITSDKLVFRIAGNVQNKEEIKLNANEWRILSLIDGTRTIREIITKSGYDEFAVYKIFFSLNSYGLIEQTEEVQLSDKPDSKDFSAVITVYNDILQSISKNIEGELGERGSTLFNEVKVQLEDHHAALLEYYHPSNHVNINIKSILDEMESLIAKGNEEELVRDMLLEGFSSYTTLLLEKIAEILGMKPVQGILTEIENIIGYVKKYHTDSREKNRIVNDVSTIINTIQSNQKGDQKKSRKSKGIFSFFG
ncbi:conserved hypothetical protein [Desulfamplus magnetovallimortis]|uniref:PatA-like N-terminal domain-containing protein n=1 Tax=Desulfamplus magnetovallimortis TaxID=1246637 RepID=A0A1W1H694_9BACT|nr:DUF4388 domain-containing protein [Desulfamplus magnetovallimortis]SLM27977.1 conserved hypothetical protein [Desulfamplus magnetovallimortis]